jgi:hypothetical protein
MKCSFRLGNHAPIEDAAAKRFYDEMCEAGITQGNCWTYWNYAKQLGCIEISIATISVVFKFEDLGREEYFSIMQTACADVAKNSDPWNKENPNNVIYRRMLAATTAAAHVKLEAEAEHQ